MSFALIAARTRQCQVPDIVGVPQITDQIRGRPFLKPTLRDDVFQRCAVRRDSVVRNVQRCSTVQALRSPDSINQLGHRICLHDSKQQLA
jgi:hypothetical protein